MESFLLVSFELIWQGIVEGTAYELMEEGWEALINESKKNKQVSLDLAVALKKCFYLSQKIIAQGCLEEIVEKSTCTQYRGVKTYNPPENDKDIKNIEQKIELLEKQLKQVHSNNSDHQSIINSNKIQQLLTQLSQSTYQSSEEAEEYIEKLFKEAEKDCDVNIYKTKLRDEENGLRKQILNSFLREIEHNERLNRIFSAQKLSKIDSTTERTEAIVKNILESIHEQSKNNSESLEQKQELKPAKVIPYQKITNFKGRQQELATLHSMLQQNDSMAICAVVGMGGVGKTQLAVNYSHEYEADYSGGICWVKAQESNIDALASQIVQFVKLYMNLKVPQEAEGTPISFEKQLEWYWWNWKPQIGKVLIVFDDVIDWESCKQLMPTVNRFSVLITTRLQNLSPNLVNEISLDVLSPEDAKALLIDLVADKSRIDDEQLISKLCQRLGYLPLSLQLVGAYLKEDPDLSLEKILRMLNESTDSTQTGVTAAFELSWLKLDDFTQQVAQLLSLFAADDVIPWKLVEEVSQKLNWASSEVNKAKIQLYKFNFIQRVSFQESSYRIHILIRDFLKDKLTASEKKEGSEKAIFSICKTLRKRVFGVKTASDFKQVFVKVMVSIAQEIPDNPTVLDIESVENAIPHLKEVAENLIAVVPDKDLIDIFAGIARFYEGQGLYTLAESWREQCLSTVKQRLGYENLYVAQSLNNLAGVYDLLGRYVQAEPLYLQALEMRKRLLGEEHPDVATTLNNLANIYHSQIRYEQVRYDQAESFYLQALEMRKRLLGEEHPDVASSLNDFAGMYHSQGKYEKAEPLYLQALEMRKRLLGDEHLDIATSLNNLALLYHSQGNYEQAKPLYQQALKIRKRLLGEEHPFVAKSLNNLAFLYHSLGDKVEAEALYKQALEMRKRLLGEEHPFVASSLNNLARLYHENGNYEQAKPLYQQAFEIRKRLLGEEHPFVAKSLNNVAFMHYLQGNYEQAKPLYQRVLEIRKRLLGEEHLDIASSLNNLARLYHSQGDYDQAEVLYLQALEMRKRLLGEEHPDVKTTLENLYLLHKSMGH